MHRLFCVLHLALSVAAACALSVPVQAFQTTRDGFLDVSPAAGAAALRLHYEETGEGPAVVLLHGLAGSTYSWRAVAPRLAAAGFKVIAIDLKGFGASAKPQDDAYAPEDHAAVVRAFLAARGLTRVSVVGHSMGGLVGLVLAIQTGAGEAKSVVIDRLVLISTPAFPQAVTGAFALLQQPVLPYVLLAVMPPELPVALGLGFEAKDFSKVRTADVAAYAAPLSTLAGQHALIATAAHLKSEGAERLIAAYGQIQQPTLVMACLDDGIVPPSTAVRLSRTLPRGHLRLLDGCRHLAPEQTPEAVSAGIAAFLTQR